MTFMDSAVRTSISTVTIHQEAPENKLLNKIRRIGHGVGDAVSDVFGHTKNLYCVSLFFNAIVNSVKYLEKPLELANNIALKKFVKINTHFITCIDGVLLLIDLKEILSRDDNGRWLWEKHWQQILEKLAWTGNHIFDFVDFLKYLKMFKLNEVGISTVQLGSAVCKIVACTFGIWDRVRSICH